MSRQDWHDLLVLCSVALLLSVLLLGCVANRPEALRVQLCPSWDAGGAVVLVETGVVYCPAYYEVNGK